MPDEDGRETLAPLPSHGGGTNVPLDAPGASSPPDAPAPSADQDQVSQEGTAPSTQPEPEKYNVPPKERWDELVKERNDARRLAELALQKLQAPQAPPAPPETDPYAGMDAPTAEFYRHMDKRIEQKAAQLADTKIAGVLQAVDAGRRELAEIKISQFRKENPDIKPGSQEETAIAGFVQQGFDLTTAKKLAMYDALETENRALKNKSQSRTAAVPQKVAANVEAGSGVPEASGLPSRRTSATERASQVYDESGGDLTKVLKAMFHNKRG